MNPHLIHKVLSTADILIIAVYFCVVFAIGFYFSRKERTTADYFMTSRNVGWFAIGASLFVSNISTEHFIGLAGSGASSGLAVEHFEWLACFMLLILGWIFVPFYLRSNVFTMPEFLAVAYLSGARPEIVTQSGFLTKNNIDIRLCDLTREEFLGQLS